MNIVTTTHSEQSADQAPSQGCVPVNKTPLYSPQAISSDVVDKWEYICVKSDAAYWKAQYERVKSRSVSLEKQIQALKASQKQQNTQLQKVIDELKAKVKLREKQLFGKKTEKHSASEKADSVNSNKKPRGQQRGSQGHGRTKNDNLSEKSETLDLEDSAKLCSTCSHPFEEFGTPESTEIIEIEVSAHRRIIKRPRYKKTCHCAGLPGVITAPPPARVIKKGKLGVSAWVEILLSKFDYYNPHARKLRELKSLGLNLSSGTLTQGLKIIAQRYFRPVYDVLKQQSRLATHWHADETRWQVFELIEGKEGYRWYLWVFHSEEVVVYFLDPTRSSRVPKTHLSQCKGILSVDRYSAYKVFLKGALIILAYCWAHVRRDFLDLAKKYPEQDSWAMAWVEKIGELYHLNKKRLAVLDEKDQYALIQTQLVDALSTMQAASKEQQKVYANPKHALSAGDEACLKVLKSLDAHWTGLTVFADHPEVPMDNNIAENSLRGPVVLRKGCRGSGSQWSGDCMAMSLSIFKTLALHKLNTRTWLTLFLQACAEASSKLPKDWKTKFLPWKMSAKRKKMMSLPLGFEDSS